jgi:hypothetical protein
MPQLFAAKRDSSGAIGSFGQAKACIVLFLGGGPPQMETWDMKPEAPAEVRGPFKPIATNVPGIQVCELMPRTSRLLDKICVLRALSTMDNAHSSSGYWMLTGTPHAPMNVENARPGAPNNSPSTAALIQRLRASRNGLPSSIVVPEHIWNDGNIPWPGQDGGYLGRTADPWLIACQPQQPGFTMSGMKLADGDTTQRMHDRRTLLHKIDRALDHADKAGFVAHEDRHRQAFDLVRGGKARNAFDLDKECPKLRDRYGRNRFGQSVLLARRLVESGVSLVQVNWTRSDTDKGGSPMWDTHAKNAEHLKNHLMPIMDLAYSALLEDLALRGLLDSTLVVWMGEFGRTPKINANAGRDHWGPVFSAALAGGGVKGGQLIGSSDKNAAYPKDGRQQPQDLQATVFHCMGYDSHTEVHDTMNRPLAITRGQVIRQAVGL